MSSTPREDRPDPGLVEPIDAADPRYVGAGEDPAPERPRHLVRSQGPGPSALDPRVRILRAALPLITIAIAVGVGAMFLRGLGAGERVRVIGPEEDVRAAVADRPLRVCIGEFYPCAWVTVVDDRLVAFNTSGPLREEYGRNGVGWCPSSEHFGANNTGSRFDQAGQVVRGPAPRSLDRFGLRLDADGQVVIDFASLTTGLQMARVTSTRPPTGPDCETIPFDREADLPPLTTGD
jgi:hypothetical protein